MRWRSDLIFFLVLFGATFGAVLPFVCRFWRHSYYYQGSHVPETESGLIKAPRSLGSNRSETAGDEQFFLLITVVTVQREGQYLSRVIGKLQELIGPDDWQYRVMICNVDTNEHQEAVQLSHIYPRVDRHGNNRRHRHGHGAKKSRQDIFDREKDDYVFCLNASRQMWASDYILILEDDALPLDDLLPMTWHLLNYRLVQHSTDFYYVKLYHPERLQGFLQPEPWRIAEWLAISTLASSVLMYAVYPCVASHRRSQCKWKTPTSDDWKHWLLWIIYWMLLTETVGRHHLLELRRISHHFYNVLSATECCTPAMYLLYSAASADRVIEFLSSVECRAGYAKDTALYYHIRQQGIKSFVVEPNLVQHIGDKSSIRI